MRVLKLNNTGEFLSVESWKDVMHLLWSNRAFAVQNYEGKKLCSPTDEWDYPAVIMMTQYVKTKKRGTAYAATTRNVLIRDNFECQYCGEKLNHSTGTKDHVIPSAKGGRTKMNNLVACCKPCNALKDDRTCEQACMFPKTLPVSMSPEEKLKSILKTFKTKEKEVWFKYLNENGISLW